MRNILNHVTPKEKSPMEKFGEWILAHIFFVPLYIGMAFYYGWSVSVLWGWFAAPKFNLPTLSIFEAAGLMLLVLSITMRPTKHEVAWWTWFTYPLYAVFAGWLIKLFV